MLKRLGVILIVWFLAAAAVAGGSFSSVSSAANNAIKIESGMISGVASADGEVVAYKGIPFAAAPVGNLRWKPPQPATPWEGVRACTEFGASCPQQNLLERLYGQKLGPTSEDCLFLNVWAPSKKPAAKLPVMVWIHGGGYTMGSGASRSYEGEAFARQGVVLVTINYRLGPFGFFAHPLLSRESDHNSSGNYGLLDQIFALQWVKQNIAAFGGDSGRVTIFGESAGAGSVCYLMASPLAKGLFHRAIAESGSAFGANRHLRETWYGQEPMEKAGERIAKDLGCDKGEDTLAALRAIPADKLLAGSNVASNFFFGGDGNRFAPIVDGWVIPDDPGAIFEAGKHNIVPLIAGSNADEGNIFLLSLQISYAEQYRGLVRRVMGANADAVLALYPAANAAEIRSALNRYVTDSAFVTGARYFVRAASKVNSKTFLYHFARVRNDARGQALGAFHASEIPYVFGTLGSFGSAFDDVDRSLSKNMIAYWARFAATGDPNGAGFAQWPAYTAAKDQHIEFGNEIKVRSGLRKEAADLFEQIAVERRAKRK